MRIVAKVVQHYGPVKNSRGGNFYKLTFDVDEQVVLCLSKRQNLPHIKEYRIYLINIPEQDSVSKLYQKYFYTYR